MNYQLLWNETRTKLYIAAKFIILQTLMITGCLTVLFIAFNYWMRWEMSKLQTLSPSTHYTAEIAQAANRYGIDPVLLAGIVKAESNFDPNAVSYAGAKGLAQLMPVVYADHCGGIDPFNPVQNLTCSANYLAWLFSQLPTEELVVAAYHGGIGNVLACMCVPRPIDRVYVERVMAGKALAMERPTYTTIPAALPSSLYGGAGYIKTQGWHQGETAVAGYDFQHMNGCGGRLYAPMNGTITMNGTESVTVDGEVLTNTILIIQNGPESIVLYHGDYTATVGSQVEAGATPVGSENTHGWSSGCHTHMSYRVNGIPQTYVN